jgi:tetratricopeptide (TPR) repeat protein
MEDLIPLSEADRHFELASRFEASEDYDRAWEECNAALGIARSFLADVYNLQGIILEGLDRPEEALEAYRKALRTEPGLTEAADNLNALEAEMGFEPRLVTLVRLPNILEARIVQATLGAEGIHSTLADQDEATGELSLQVMEADVVSALDILGLEPEDMPPDEPAEDDNGTEMRCPVCGSAEVRPKPSGAWRYAVGLPRSSRDENWMCDNCGHKWA